MQGDKNSQILTTNLEPFFWKNAKRIIDQNKKGGLENFLFPKEKLVSSFSSTKNTTSYINTLKNKIEILERKNIELKNLLLEKENPNFQNLKHILDQEKREIIQKGFQLQVNRKIVLKNYYQSDEKKSLNRWKGYRIKYETIRRTKLYQELKDSQESKV